MTIDLWVGILTVGGPFIAWIFWIIIGSKFVTQEKFDERIKLSDELRSKFEAANAELRGKVALLEQEVGGGFSRMNDTLTDIKNSLTPFILDHQVLKDRVTKIELSK